ncbi:MAG: ribosomal protein S18-alanine N-acetyltransferase [Thermoplasmata archaeon]
MLTIRMFNPADVQEIVAITEKSLREAYPPSFFLTISQYWPEGFLVAQIDAEIVGFIMGVISGIKQARILMLAVKDGYRRSGIASALIRSFKSSCTLKGLDSIILEVRVSNDAAINLYNKFGFRIINTMRAYYRDGEDGYRMETVLQT